MFWTVVEVVVRWITITSRNLIRQLKCLGRFRDLTVITTEKKLISLPLKFVILFIMYVLSVEGIMFTLKASSKTIFNSDLGKKSTPTKRDQKYWYCSEPLRLWIFMYIRSKIYQYACYVNILSIWFTQQVILC